LKNSGLKTYARKTLDYIYVFEAIYLNCI